MKKCNTAIIGIVILTLAAAGVLAGDMPASPADKAAKALDKLLLDTPHVYIQSTHQVHTFQMPDAGTVFTGEIMMDAYAGIRTSYRGIPSGAIHALPVAIPGLLKGLSSLSELSNLAELAKLADVPELKDSNIDFEKLAALSELSELAELKDLEQLEKLSKLEVLADLESLGDMEVKMSEEDGRKIIILKSEKSDKESSTGAEKKTKAKPTDAERLDAFKIELMDTMLAHADQFAAGDGDDMVTVVLQVRDEDFKTTQGAGYLRTQIPARKLLKLKGKSASDPDVMEAFRCNW
ncbi:MAG TPA: hypothetical protein PLV45_18105 [bacterium]|nr:hypothetical protein [bacterium]